MVEVLLSTWIKALPERGWVPYVAFSVGVVPTEAFALFVFGAPD